MELKLREGFSSLDLDHSVIDLGLVALLILLVGLLIFSLADSSELSIEGSEEVNEREVPSVVYNITSNGVFPYEHVVEPGENIGVYNSVGEEITLYGDDIGPISLESGDYIVYSLDRITYFEANVSESRVGQFKVNVQRS